MNKPPKRITLLLVISLLLLIFLAFAVYGEKNRSNPAAPFITMSTEAAEIRIELSGKGKAVIDWGSGEAERVTLNSIAKAYSRSGLPPGATIRVEAENGVTALYCGNNSLTSLDLRENPALAVLDCTNNNLASLDVSRNPALTDIACWGNSLTSLDPGGNPALELLFCSRNSIRDLDVSNNAALTWLDCRDNGLDAAALNALFGTLPPREPADAAFIRCGGNPGYAAADAAIAAGKNWKVEE